MSTAALPDAADDEDVDAVIAPPARRFSKKLMIIVAGVVIIVLAGAAAAYFLLRPASGEPQAEAEVPAEAFVDVPALIVNLRSSDGDTKLIKLHVLLVPTDAAKSEEIKAKLPLVIDRYQPFLRELRPEDLMGSAALFRIKEELLIRSNDAVGAGSVGDVLIQDLIQQ